MPISQQKKLIEKRRAATRERVKQHRKKLRFNSLQKTTEANAGANNESSVGETNTPYKCTQSLGKAVKKAMKALPASGQRKNMVLRKIVMNMNDNDRKEFVNIISPSTQKKKNNSELVEEIKTFYERDDISRVSPKARDVKQYHNIETGQKIHLATRHMLLSLKKAYAIFDNERKIAGKGIQNSTKFYRILFHIVSMGYFFIIFTRWLWPYLFCRTSTKSRQIK